MTNDYTFETETAACTSCGTETDVLAIFPGGRCLACHAAIWERVPVSQLPVPNFAGTLNLKPRRKGVR